MKTDYKPEEIAQIKVLLDDAYAISEDAEKLKDDLIGVESLMNTISIKDNYYHRQAMARLRAATDNARSCMEEIEEFRKGMIIACDLPVGE